MPRERLSFVPTELSGCVLWLKPDQTTMTLDASSLVTQWADQSGNANHATGTNTISYVRNALNTGKPMLKGLGSGKLTTPAINLGAFTLAILVSGPANATLSYLAVHNSDSGSVDGSYFYGQTPQSFVRRGTNRSITVPTALGGPDWLGLAGATRLAIQKWGAEHRVYRNGQGMASSGTTDAGSISAPLYLMGSQAGGGTFNHYMGEVVLYNRELTDAEIATLSGYFHKSWGTY